MNLNLNSLQCLGQYLIPSGAITNFNDRVIESTEPTVMNNLIDQRRIENMVLVDSRDEAIKLMFGARTPRSVNEVYTYEGTRVFITYACYPGSTKHKTNINQQQKTWTGTKRNSCSTHGSRYDVSSQSGWKDKVITNSGSTMFA